MFRFAHILTPLGLALSLSAAAPEANLAQAKTALSGLPLRFEMNRGQFDPAIRYAARGAGYNLLFTAAGASLRFGDGVHGARLPTGLNNVVVRYRYGSGAEAPARGALTVLAKPWPGLRAVRNPVSVGGGADPDPPDPDPDPADPDPDPAGSASMKREPP